MLAKTQILDKFDLSAVTLIMSGGAPMTRAVEDILFSRFPTVRIITQGQNYSESLFISSSLQTACNGAYFLTIATEAHHNVIFLTGPLSDAVGT